MEIENLDKIVEFAKKFDNSEKSTVQLKNYKKLLNYINTLGVDVSVFDAEELLNKSKEISHMTSVLSSLSDEINFNKSFTLSLSIFLFLKKFSNLFKSLSYELIVLLL